MSASDKVREMNQHFASALRLIEQSASDNNAQIREEIKAFFTCAEEIQKFIAKSEVKSIKYVKQCELEEIEKQKANVTAYLEHFQNTVGEIESSLRQCIRENSPLLQC